MAETRRTLLNIKERKDEETINVHIPSGNKTAH